MKESSCFIDVIFYVFIFLYIKIYFKFFLLVRNDWINTKFIIKFTQY